MPKYLIELTHGDEHECCVKALESIERYGAHLLTNLDWGCEAGIHSGWLIAEVGSQSEAIQIVPPLFRQEARIVQLNKFTREDIAALVSEFKQETESPGVPQETFAVPREVVVNDEWSISSAGGAFFELE